MKYKITENQNSITLLLTPVIFYSSTYLFEKYGVEKPYHFATGIIRADYKTEFVPMLKDLVVKINSACEKNLGVEKIKLSDLFAEKKPDNYPLFTWHTDKDGNQTGEIAVACRNPRTTTKPLLYLDLAETLPVAEDDAYKNLYAIELEIKAYFNEDTLSVGVYTVFHRGIKSGNRSDLENAYVKNDEAWDGFDFETPDEIADEDLPF